MALAYSAEVASATKAGQPRLPAQAGEVETSILLEVILGCTGFDAVDLRPGEPVLEMMFHGMLIFTLESGRLAMEFPARASLNEQDTVPDHRYV